jgi:hypothetical protein
MVSATTNQKQGKDRSPPAKGNMQRFLTTTHGGAHYKSVGTMKIGAVARHFCPDKWQFFAMLRLAPFK